VASQKTLFFISKKFAKMLLFVQKCYCVFLDAVRDQVNVAMGHRSVHLQTADPLSVAVALFMVWYVIPKKAQGRRHCRLQQLETIT
jgi:hypothetical protein